MLAVSTIYTPRTITGHEHQHGHTATPDAGAPDAGEWPALLQQSLAMWEHIFAHQSGATAPSAPTEALIDPSHSACAL